MVKQVFRAGLWLAVVPAVFLAAETSVSAQMKLRGPGPLTGPQLLLPRQPIALMNNGSLQTTQNPNANLPNQVRFIYIAAMPLGDRLGNNGVYYDTDILPNIGLFQGGQNLFGQVQQQPPVKAARMARQRMMPNYMQQAAMQQAYMQQAYMQQAYMQQAYMQQAYLMQAFMLQAYTDPSTLSGYDPNNVGAGGFRGFTAPTNNANFGAGFRTKDKDDGGD